MASDGFNILVRGMARGDLTLRMPSCFRVNICLEESLFWEVVLGLCWLVWAPCIGRWSLC